jgi:hypothetical protein
MTPELEAQIRGDFEKEFSAPPYEFSLKRYGEDGPWPGNYRDYSLQCAWCGYLAGRANVIKRLEQVGTVRLEAYGYKSMDHTLAQLSVGDKLYRIRSSKITGTSK